MLISRREIADFIVYLMGSTHQQLGSDLSILTGWGRVPAALGTFNDQLDVLQRFETL